jgi:hypothetical protein
MADAGQAGERLALKPRLEIPQLAFSATALEVAVLDGGHARGIVAAIFQPLERIDQLTGNGLAAKNPDNSAH